MGASRQRNRKDCSMDEELTELQMLIAKYDSEDDVGNAIVACERENFELMTGYSSGVPSGVVFQATMSGIQRTSSLLANMIIELRGIVESWTDEEVTVQMALTSAVLTLMMDDSLNAMLKMMRPMEPDDEQ
jgi:hypothetical protein